MNYTSISTFFVPAILVLVNLTVPTGEIFCAEPDDVVNIGVVDVQQSGATPTNGGCVEGGVTRGCFAHCVGHDGYLDLLKDRGETLST